MPRKRTQSGRGRKRSNKHKSKKKVKKEIKQQTYKRIIRLLKIYSKWANDNQRKNIYSLICNYYQSSNINAFLTDYDYIITNIDKDKEYLNHSNKCNPRKCLFFSRNYRNRNELSQYNRKRIALYHDIKDEQQIVIIQYLDIMHNTFYHLIDSGLRYHDNNKNNGNTLKKRKENIRNNRCKMVDNHKKFVTHFNNNNDDDEYKQNDNNNNTKYKKYSEGIRYFYHKRYKDMHQHNDKIPGINTTDSGNPGYFISDWFIEPKYANLKTEILTNDKFNFSMEQWINTNIKTELKWNQYTNNINKASCVWRTLYGYTSKTIVRYENILCLLLYTNYDYLATKLTQTYRKSSNEESDNSLKIRHSYFVHLGKGLKETVEVFGIPLHDSKHKEFYHGINIKMVFGAFRARFCSPTSTTILKDVAINYAMDGIILTINNNKHQINYFNCIPFSDFPGEAEMLFISGYQSLEIIGLTDLSISRDYDEYIRAITILETCLTGIPSLHNLSDSYYNTLSQLINYKLSSSQSNESNPSSIPPYIRNIFDHILSSLGHFGGVSINVGLLKKELVYTDTDTSLRPQYGYLKLFSLFMDSSDWIHLNVLHRLVPQTKAITIVCMKYSSNGDTKFVSSIKITDDIVLDICNILSYWSLEEVNIIKPFNSFPSLELLIHKYNDRLLKYGYKSQIVKSNVVPFGSCDTYNIIKC